MITVKLNTRDFVKDLSDKAKKQVPFAEMKAVNETATDFQTAERQGIAERFTLRRPSFILNTVKIERGDFATKDNPRAIVRIDPNRDVLMKFEEDLIKQSRSGNAVAIPVDARRSKLDIVLKSARPKALQLVDISRKGGTRVAEGLKRTFLIQRADGSGGIFQRVGRGKHTTIRELFAFKRTVQLPRSLEFEQTARLIAEKNFAANMKKWLERALATAK